MQDLKVLMVDKFMKFTNDQSKLSVQVNGKMGLWERNQDEIH